MAIEDDSARHGPLGDTQYHRVASRVIGLANQLRALGVGSALQLPALVIAGDQSSGKSSVVEAIAGVSLPRSDGTCTRCPTEVRLRTHAGPDANGDSPMPDGDVPWTCRIKLHREYDSDGHPLTELPPEELFATLTNKAHIAAFVTAAQAVLLNPRAADAAPGGARAFVPDVSGDRPRDPQPLRALGHPTTYELSFTANKVVLEVDGADADLTIIDLPGIIHDHPKGKQYVDMVERMTKAQLRPEHHIIAMALPAGLDPETQAIRLWVREVDPSGSRSIGIITKPDTIADDAHITYGKLVKLVGGSTMAGGAAGAAASAGPAAGHDESHQLTLGYYVVRNPGQEQLEDCIGFAEARAAEQRYFATNTHWVQAVAALPSLKQRLGANHLRSGLSALLVERIETQLPHMRRAAREQLLSLGHELAAMPRPPSDDPQQELRGLLWQAADLLDSRVSADARADSKEFYQRVHAVFREYGERAIRSTPAFLVGTTLISALSHEDKGMATDSAGTAASAMSDGVIDVASYGASYGTSTAAAAALAEDERLRGDVARQLFPSEHMTLEQVQRLHQRHLGAELPTFSPYSAMEELVRGFKGRWREHAQACLEAVLEAVDGEAQAVLEAHFGRYPKALRVLSTAVSAYVDRLASEADGAVREVIAMEDDDTFTLNTHYFRAQFATFLGRLKRAYLKPPALDAHNTQQVQALLSSLAAYGFKFSSPDDLFMAQPTPVDDELHAMAACLAYFKVAFKRVQDGVPLHIRRFLLRRLGSREGLEAALAEHLGTGAPAAAAGDGGAASGAADKAEVARLLLAEDEAVAARRSQLRDLERRLREAVALLNCSPGVQA
ncbi:hypothetical protein HYH03_012919 [Edaphochlamys debaryana]|uniref:GED domain-containing protein n=1 Tax=Edaphochlamys debaryana TaxID=47281 RepID=A0A835XXD2_9CHLO|nr:hypothetical protein HYH03_012919 [Edaphochlamys debaryana]|eukprot:KAG2488600.1 hypothetical protein HYH03_012919 [Edaphochlamys debaryana]